LQDFPGFNTIHIFAPPFISVDENHAPGKMKIKFFLIISVDENHAQGTTEIKYF